MKKIDTKKKTLMAFRTMAPMLLLCACVFPCLLSAQTHYAQVLKDVEANNPVLLAAQKRAEAQQTAAHVGALLPNPEVEAAYYWGDPASVGVRWDLGISQSFEMPSVMVRDVDIEVDNDYLYIKDQLIEKIYEKTRKSDKDQWRDDNETRAIAETDAKLLLTALTLNKDIQPDSEKELLYANTYLVTYTTKSIKSAKELKIYRKVVTRPEILINLLMEIGLFDDKHNGMFNLFDNPFLAQIMSEHWDVLTALSKTGVDLRTHKSVTKLVRDLGATVHTYLTKNSDVEHIDSSRRVAVTTGGGTV